MTKQRILVTGGAGFIGSHIVHHHLNKGDEVWAVDNLYAGSLFNISTFRNNPSFRFDKADVRFWAELEKAVKWADRIYHLAGFVGQKLILSHPIDTLSNNIGAGEAVLKAMNQAESRARIVFTSTSEVYCNSDEDSDGTVSEETIINFKSGKVLQETYPVSKLVNELTALAYNFEKQIPCTVARLFNTIGVRQSPAYGMVVPSFMNQAIAQKPLTIYGDGKQTRSFSDARDTARALDLLLSTPESIGEIVNVGDDRECSINDLAKLVLKVTGSHSPIEYMTYLEAYGLADFVDVRRRRPNLQKLRRLTGFKPQYSLAETIQEIYRALTENLSTTVK